MIRFLALVLPLLIFAQASGVRAQERVRRNVEVDWERIEGAIAYEVQVVRKDDRGRKPQRFKVKEPRWSATIRPGQYLMQIRSLDSRGVPGDWSEASDLLVRLPAVIPTSPAPGKVVMGKDENKEEVSFSWVEVPGAAKYKIQARTADGSWSEEETVGEPRWRAQVPVGQFINWHVTAVSPNDEPGDTWSEPQTFELRGPPLPKPEIEAPHSPYLKEVTWRAPKHAQTYNYDLKYFNPKSRRWQLVESKRGHRENRAILDVSKPSGKYRLNVQALGDRRVHSKVAQLDFDMVGGFRDPSALENAITRQSISKPTNFYAIASYLVTQVQYSGKNYDENSSGSFDALGGTGRLGLGYQHPQSSWGGFGIVDLSGFIIEGQNFRFASAEAHVTRKLEFGQGGLLLFGTGLFLKELPIVIGTPVDGFSSVGKVRSLGPHAGFTYWVPLNQRFGVQMNARAYYTLAGSASGGRETEAALSYQYGLLGSLRLSREWMGYAGYAYRQDSAVYATDPSDPLSNATAGQTNEIRLQGHYLNLILEFSF